MEKVIIDPDWTSNSDSAQVDLREDQPDHAMTNQQHINTEQDIVEVEDQKINFLSNTAGQDTQVAECLALLMKNSEAISKLHSLFANPPMFIVASEDYSCYQNSLYRKMENVVEIYNIPANWSQDYLVKGVIQSICEHTRFCGKKVGDSHAIAISRYPQGAKELVSGNLGDVKTRYVEQGSPIAIMAACSIRLKALVDYDEIWGEREESDTDTQDGSCEDTGEENTDSNSNNTPDESDKDNSNIISNGSASMDQKKNGKADELQHLAPLVQELTTVPEMQDHLETTPALVIASENYGLYQNDIYRQMEKVVELYNIPSRLSKFSLSKLFENEACYIIRFHVNHALVITTSKEEAQRICEIRYDVIRARNVLQGSPIAFSTACSVELLQFIKSFATPAGIDKNLFEEGTTLMEITADYASSKSSDCNSHNKQSEKTVNESILSTKADSKHAELNQQQYLTQDNGNEANVDFENPIQSKIPVEEKEQDNSKITIQHDQFVQHQVLMQKANEDNHVPIINYDKSHGQEEQGNDEIINSKLRTYGVTDLKTLSLKTIVEEDEERHQYNYLPNEVEQVLAWDTYNRQKSEAFNEHVHTAQLARRTSVIAAEYNTEDSKEVEV